MIEPIKQSLRFLRREISVHQIQRQLKIQDAPKPFRINVEKTIDGLLSNGVSVTGDRLDDQAVSLFAQQAEYEFYYPNYYLNRELVRLKKIREHYVAAKILGLKRSDLYLDIASQYSPAPQIYERLYGCQVFRQDFEYPVGRHGRVLGGSAAHIQLDDNSITKAAMHCSLEHFEGDEDIALIKEMERILAPDGLFVVVPLYLSDEYLIFTQSSLYADLPKAEWPKFDPTATLYAANGGNCHERYYDTQHFLGRLVNNTKMKVTIYSFGAETNCTLGQMRLVAVFRKSIAV